MKIKPFKGKVKIGSHSGLRKLARAMRRGLLPDERANVIARALKFAQDRPEAFLHASRVRA